MSAQPATIAPGRTGAQKNSYDAEETGMIKPFVMSLAMTGLGVSAMGADGQNSSPATWRWHVTQILAAQSEGEALPILDARAFDQRYERYSPVGLPEPAARA